MTKTEQILGQGSTENKVISLANHVLNMNSGNEYQLSKVAFMNFRSDETTLSDHLLNGGGHITHLIYSHYSGNHMVNDLYFFPTQDALGDNHYIGVGKAANVFTRELLRLKGDENGLVVSPTAAAASEFDTASGVFWSEPYTLSGPDGEQLQILLTGPDTPTTPPHTIVSDSGVTLALIKREDGTLVYQAESQEPVLEPYTGQDVIAPSEFLAQLEAAQSQPDLPTFTPDSCLFPLTMDFKLEVWFPAGTAAPTADEIEISLVQPSGYDNEHFYPYRWDDANKKLTVYGALTDCLNFNNADYFNDTQYSTEFENNGAVSLYLKCDGLDFGTAEQTVMQGGITIHGAEPWEQLPM